MGLSEAERRKFDYGCIILRDVSRPLVSQVLWSHEEGLEKDIRTLIFEGGAALKLYFVRDRIKNRAKIDEVIQSYRQNPSTANLLRGLKIIPVPEDFDADLIKHQNWMNRYILDSISSDLLFAVVFGKLSASDVRTFGLHGGPVGLKMAALHVISTVGFEHGPTLEKAVGAKGSPLREAIAMLTGLGLIAAPTFSVQRVPTIKGRFLIDLARLLTFERETLSDWSDETKLILNYLKLDPASGWQESANSLLNRDFVNDALTGVEYAYRQFGVDVMEGVNRKSPQFHSKFEADGFLSSNFIGTSPELWSDPDDIANFLATEPSYS